MKPGDKIDDYQLLHLCGRGAFGTVFLAKDSKDHYVALKVVSLTGEYGERELQALESYRKCCHHNCMLKITDAVMKEDYFFFYYVMEPADNLEGADSENYVPCTLSEVLRRRSRLTVAETTVLVNRLLEVLAIIHGNKLVHRDIKPANIFWVNGQVKLGDIGLLANENSLTINAGSQGFMPPPNSGIDQNSTKVDLFALTRLIYVCLSGNPVYEIPDLKPTDDIFRHGQNLLHLMNLTNPELAKMTVQDFQHILNPKKGNSKMFSMAYSLARLSGLLFSAESEESKALKKLSNIPGVSSASDWLKKQEI